MNRRIISIIITSLLFVSGCGPTTPTNENGVLNVGTEAVFPPFGKVEGNGELSGFDIDIINAIGEAKGMRVNIHNMAWEPLFQSLNSKKVDAAIAGISMNEQRKSVYDFSLPYFEVEQVILVPNKSKVSRFKDLKGKRIGVQFATTGDILIKEAYGPSYKKLMGYEDMGSVIDDLVLGRLDAVVADNAVIFNYIKKVGQDNFRVVKDPYFKKEHFGIIVKKGNNETLELINSGLEAIRNNGKYGEIFKKYFPHGL